MFAEGKRLMVRRETWTVSQAWEAPGDFFSVFLMRKRGSIFVQLNCCS